MGGRLEPSAAVPSDSVATPLAGAALVLAGAVCFATMPTFAKLAYAHGADPNGLLAVRCSAAALAFLIVISIRGRSAGRGRWRLRITLLGLVFCAQAFAFFEALALTTAAIAVLLFYTFPLFVAVAGTALLGESLTWTKALILLLGFAGVVLTVGGVSGAVSLVGVSLALASSLLFAAFLILSKQVLASSSLGPLELTGLMYLVAACGFVAIALVRGASLPADDAGWAAITGVVVLGTIASMGLLIAGLDRLPAGVTSMLSTLEPSLSVAFAAIVLGETITIVQSLGIGLVLASILCLGLLMVRVPESAAHARWRGPA